jgi:phage tail-like protein
MRNGLPAIYQEGDFGMRWIGALETVLDPVVSLLDNLASHFDPNLAPMDLLELMAGWLGVELDESWPEERQREQVRQASELSRRRGTKSGLELALAIAYPDLPLRVEDNGGVVWATSADKLPPAKPPGFVVYCDEPIDEPAHVARTIEQLKPVHVGYRLRVKRTQPPARPPGGTA